MIDRRALLKLLGASMTAAVTGRTAAQVAGTASSPANATEGLVDVVGGRLHYQAVGEGPPLVLLHKLGGRLQEWRRVIPAFSSQYRVIAVDLAGHGQSEMTSPPPFIVTQEAAAAQLMAALDSLEVAPPYRFVGSSAGGCVAIVCAALWPERVAAVVSLGSALGGATTRRAQREAAAKAIAEGYFDNEERPLPRDFSYAQRAFGVEDRAIAREQNDSRAQAGRWISPLSRGVGLFDYLALLPRVQAPVLLAWGERGNYGAFVDAALARLPAGEKAMIPDSGAFPHEEAPAATIELVLSFLDRTAPSG